LYNPASGNFSAAGKVAIDATCESTATLLPDGRVLIAGGYGANYSVSKLAELYDPATGKFTRTGSLYTARGAAQAVLLPDGRVLVMGGAQVSRTLSEVILNSSEIYDPATGKFSKAATMETPRTDFSATMLTDGKVLVAGGADVAGESGTRLLDSAELYNPATGKFSPTGSMTIARSADWGTSYESGLEYMHTSLLHDGRVLFIGGDEPQEGSSVYQPTAEIYDPATGVFSATAALPVSDIGNDNNSSVTLKDGRVLIPGIPSLLYTP
jgi:hypothetical protein